MSSEDNRNTTLTLVDLWDSPNKYWFQSPVVIFRNNDLADHIGVSHKTELSQLTHFLTDYGSNLKYITLTPGGVMAVIFDIHTAVGSKLTKEIDLRFSKDKPAVIRNPSTPLTIGILTHNPDFYVDSPIAQK